MTDAPDTVRGRLVCEARETRLLSAALPVGGGGNLHSQDALDALSSASRVILNNTPCTTGARRVVSFHDRTQISVRSPFCRIFRNPRKIFAPARQHKVERLCCRELPGVDGDCALSFRPRTQKRARRKIQMSNLSQSHGDLGRPSRAQFGRSSHFDLYPSHGGEEQ